MTTRGKPDPCQFLRNVLRRAIPARGAFGEHWGDMLDQGVDPDSLKRQLKALDERVARANAQLWACQHPVPRPKPPKLRTPEPARILEIVNADPAGGPGYHNDERPQPR